MTFISERIREEDKEYYYSLKPTDITGEVMGAYWWAIDRESGNYIYQKCIKNPRNDIFMDQFGLFIDKHEIVMEGNHKEEGCVRDGNLKVSWYLQKIQVPNEVLDVYSIEDLQWLIVESLKGYGLSGYERKNIQEVNVYVYRP